MDGATSWSEERVSAEARTDRGKLEDQLDANGDFRVYLGPSAGKGNIIARGNVSDDAEHGRHFVADDTTLRHMTPRLGGGTAGGAETPDKPRARLSRPLAHVTAYRAGVSLDRLADARLTRPDQHDRPDDERRPAGAPRPSG